MSGNKEKNKNYNFPAEEIRKEIAERDKRLMENRKLLFNLIKKLESKEIKLDFDGDVEKIMIKIINILRCKFFPTMQNDN